MAWTPPETDEWLPPETDEIVGGTGGKPSLGMGDIYNMIPDAPWTRLRNATLEPAGEAIAEAGGAMGYPATGAAIGTAVQMAPDLLGLYGGRQALYGAQQKSPVVQGLLNTPRELGATYEAQNAAARVVNRPVPTGGTVPRFAPFERVAATKQPTPIVAAEPVPSNVPTSYPSQPERFLSYAEQRLGNSQGKPIAPQELMDWRNKLQTDISTNRIPQFDPETRKTTQLFRAATDLRSRAGSYFNNAIEPALQEAGLQSRASLNQANRVAIIQEAVARGLWRGTKWLGGAGLTYLTGKVVVDKITGR